MDSEKTSIYDIILFFFIFLFFTILAAAAWMNGQTGYGLLSCALALFILAILVTDLKRGVRAPTPYEHFKAWMNLRPVVIGAGGLGLMALAAQVVFPATIDWPQPVKAMLVIVPLLVWGASVAYTLVRAPRRHEPDSAYKRRIGYKDQ